MGWFSTVRDGIYLALCAGFGLDPDSAEAMRKFVPAYIEDTITPQAPRNLDVCYYSVDRYTGDSGFDYIQLVQATNRLGKTVTQIKKEIPATVLLTFYGPNADDEAEEFWSMFQWDSGVNSPRAILRKKNIVPIGTPARPVSLFEVEGTYQRRRCDVRVNLAYLEITEHESSEVDTVPEITSQPQFNN